MTHRLDMFKSSVKFHEYISYGLGNRSGHNFLAHTHTGGKELWQGLPISQSCLPCSQHILT